MKIETYSDRYELDIVRLVNLFHQEALKDYDAAFDPKSIIETIKRLKGDNSGNAFLLIIDDQCRGILAGIEILSMFNSKRIWQEFMWYVEEPYRRYGVILLKKAQERLQLIGFDIMIMAVLENSKTEKIKEFYERIGFRKFETHYIRSL